MLRRLLARILQYVAPCQIIAVHYVGNGDVGAAALRAKLTDILRIGEIIKL